MKGCVVCQNELKDDARFCPNCGAEQPKVEVTPGEDPLLGAIIARKFKIEKVLGVGGMGKVYKARQLALDKAVVVKVLHDQFRDDPQLVQRFQREARAASRLNHPNSIQIIDFGQDEGGVVFMAMEFLQGQDLFAMLKKEGPLESVRLAKVMIQVCSALAEAHEMKVIHRDLKPENIMIEDRRGQRDFVKVLDFGIAKIQDPQENAGQALTQMGMVCGTPEYMSPEQARGLALDPRSDIYSLGIILYQLATGELPFTADTPIGIVTKHILEKPIPPRQKRPQIPEEMERIILKALEKEPGGRFDTVVQMGEALEEIVRTNIVATGTSSGFGNVPQTGNTSTTSGSTAAQTAANGAATGGQTTSTGVATTGTPTTTAATPTGQAAVVPTDIRPPGSPAMKIAAAAVVVVLLAAVAAIALKDKILGTEAAVVVDAGTVVAVAKVPDAGVKPVEPVVVDAGMPVVVAIVDAGTVAIAVAKPDAGFKPVVPKPDAGTPVVNNGGGANRAAAKAALNKVVGNVKPGKPCDEATRKGIFDAATKDKSFPDPFWYMALCMKGDGNKAAACSAVDEFERRGAPEAKAKILRGLACK
ncbi:MAG: serine/threonine-protein kinase [Deltaproteobacteria bacterium]|nr:serine/threonine-protein kinase [Deltaproteobacteria bacterium]